MPNILDEQFWSSKYSNQSTGWDVGEATMPLKQYLDQLSSKDLKILIPGAGNAYEAAYAHQQGFSKVHILDISEWPLKQFSQKFPDFPTEHLHHQNFFDHEGQYDLVLEQTFFCALNPSLRSAYVDKMLELLVPGGKLVGVLFDRHFEQDGPPFGGDQKEYRAHFEDKFKILKLERCYNSISPRQGSEAFIMMQKPQ